MVSGEKPFLCDVCGRGFRIKSDMQRHRLNVHFKGHKSTVIIKNDDGDDENIEEVMAADDVGSEGEEEAHFVTITTKGNVDGDDDGEGEGGSSQQTMHRLVFISENEAILV